MIPALAQICTLPAPLEQEFEDYAAGCCTAIELWFGKIEQYLQQGTSAGLRNLLERHGLRPVAASFQGGLLTSQGDARREHWTLFEKRLPLCRELGIDVLVIAGDITAPLTAQDLERAKVSLRQAAAAAAAHQVKLAFEFQASAAAANNLQSAAALIAEIEAPNLGLCLDAFHYYCGPSKPEDLAYLTPDNLFHVQFCDLLGVPREFAADADRVVPGDGDIALGPIIERLRQIDYRGAVSVELLNPQLWQVSPRSFGEIAMTALRKLLGQAAM